MNWILKFQKRFKPVGRSVIYLLRNVGWSTFSANLHLSFSALWDFCPGFLISIHPLIFACDIFSRRKFFTCNKFLTNQAWLGEAGGSPWLHWWWFCQPATWTGSVLWKWIDREVKNTLAFFFNLPQIFQGGPSPEYKLLWNACSGNGQSPLYSGIILESWCWILISAICTKLFVSTHLNDKQCLIAQFTSFLPRSPWWTTAVSLPVLDIGEKASWRWLHFQTFTLTIFTRWSGGWKKGNHLSRPCGQQVRWISNLFLRRER